MEDYLEKVISKGSHYYKGLFCMPDMERRVMEWVDDGLELAEGDVVVLCYPCAGIQWLQECLWLMKHPELIGSSEKKTELSFRVMFLDRAHRDVTPQELMDKQEPPRISKTHLHADMLAKHINQGKAKFIFWTLDPKVSLSKFHHHYDFLAPRWLGLPPCSWDTYWQMVEEKKLFEGDFCDFHKSYLPHLDDPNMLMMRYEDAALDKVAALRKVADFCGFSLTDQQLEKISTCQPMDKTPDPCAKFTPEQAAFYDDRIRNEFKGTRFENMFN